jgi:hypothetical protein
MFLETMIWDWARIDCSAHTQNSDTRNSEPPLPILFQYLQANFRRTSFTPPNALVNIANHTFIMLDAVSLIEEDYRRYAAEVQLGEWEGVPGGVIEFIKDLAQGKYMFIHKYVGTY